MLIEIIDKNANSLGKYMKNQFITIPNINDEIIIKGNHYIVNRKAHEEIECCLDTNKFELILYVEKKVRGIK